MSILMSIINDECGNLLNSLDSLDSIISSKNSQYKNESINLINEIERSIDLMLQVIEENEELNSPVKI